MDFTKAFDVIDHDLLLRKLTLYGLSNDTLHLISSFLSNREQLVCINTIKSDFLPVKYGIPQGSVLGPLLFSLYLNDLPLFIKALCELFADDTTIHSSHSNLNNLLLSLQESINNLLQWTELNHMSLNSYKTKYMTITTRQKRQNISSRMPLYIGNEKIVEVATHKVLGVTIDNNLSWTNHINELTKLVSQKLYKLAKIKHFLNAHARKLFFHAHIQPIIDYASTLWDSASANTLKPLLSIHKRALKLTLLKSTSLTAHDYKLLDVLPLKLKLEFNKGIIMHKIVFGYVPSNLKSNFVSNQNRHSHKLVVPRPRLDLFKCSLMYSVPSNLKSNFVSNQNRHSHKLVVPRPRLDLFKCSLMYSGGKLWKNLPLSIKKIIRSQSILKNI